MAYKTQSVDTSVEAEKAHFDLLRRAGMAKRYERMGAQAIWERYCVGFD